jgi:DNA repair protein RadC
MGPSDSPQEDAVNFEAFAEMSAAEMVRDARRRPRLMLGDSPYKGSVKGPEDVLAAWPELPEADREVFGVLLLNARHEATRRVVVSIGSLNASIVHPREVFRPALLYSAASIVLTHNHPSGDPEPSEEDLSITGRLVGAGELLGVGVLDHVVIGRRGHVSFRSRNLL